MPTSCDPFATLSHNCIITALLLVVALSMAACSKPMSESPPGSLKAGPGVTANPDQTPAPPPLPACCTNPDALRLAEERTRQRPPSRIYFAHDQYRMADEYLPAIAAHARYMVNNPNLVLRVAGNADERGSREYNLAIGHKRAEYVQRTLLMYGAPQQRVEVISYGSDKPVANGSNDASWQLNRRVELSYEPE